MFNLNTVIATVLDINAADFVELKNKGARPVKAAIKLGACPRKSQLIAGLQLAVTEEEINTVYANDNVKSCMTGKPVGEFYSSLNIGVIYSSMFRVLVNLDTGILEESAYGYHREPVMKVLSAVLEVGSSLPQTEHTIETMKMRSLGYETYYSVQVKTVRYSREETLNTRFLTMQDNLLLQEYIKENINTIQNGTVLVVLKTGTLVSVHFSTDVYEEEVDEFEDIDPVGVVEKKYGSYNTYRVVTGYEEKQLRKEITSDVIASEITFDTYAYEQANPEVYIPYLDSDIRSYFAAI